VQQKEGTTYIRSKTRSDTKNCTTLIEHGKQQQQQQQAELEARSDVARTLLHPRILSRTKIRQAAPIDAAAAAARRVDRLPCLASVGTLV